MMADLHQLHFDLGNPQTQTFVNLEILNFNSDKFPIKVTQQQSKHTLPTCPLLLVALVELPPLFHSGHSYC